MKKYIISLAVILLSLSTNAQKAKFGHVDYGGIMQIMPGIDTAQAVMKTYQDDLQAAAEQMTAEFKQKEKEFTQMANRGTSPSILKLKEDELNSMYQRIQEFAANSRQDMQNRQIELLKPFEDKILAAVKTVAQARNYTYIFDITTLAFHTDTDDLTDAVKTELGIR